MTITIKHTLHDVEDGATFFSLFTSPTRRDVAVKSQVVVFVRAEDVLSRSVGNTAVFLDAVHDQQISMDETITTMLTMGWQHIIVTANAMFGASDADHNAIKQRATIVDDEPTATKQTTVEIKPFDNQRSHWLDVKVARERQQRLGVTAAASNPMEHDEKQEHGRTITVNEIPTDYWHEDEEHDLIGGDIDTVIIDEHLNWPNCWNIAHTIQHINTFNPDLRIIVTIAPQFIGCSDLRFLRNHLSGDVASMVWDNVHRVPFPMLISNSEHSVAMLLLAQSFQQKRQIDEPDEQEQGYLAETFVSLSRRTVPYTLLPAKTRVNRINNKEYGCDDAFSQETKSKRIISRNDVANKLLWAETQETLTLVVAINTQTPGRLTAEAKDALDGRASVIFVDMEEVDLQKMDQQLEKIDVGALYAWQQDAMEAYEAAPEACETVDGCNDMPTFMVAKCVLIGVGAGGGKGRLPVNHAKLALDMVVSVVPPSLLDQELDKSSMHRVSLF
jgi:hypothetical protein